MSWYENPFSNYQQDTLEKIHAKTQRKLTTLEVSPIRNVTFISPNHWQTWSTLFPRRPLSPFVHPSATSQKKFFSLLIINLFNGTKVLPFPSLLFAASNPLWKKHRRSRKKLFYLSLCRISCLKVSFFSPKQISTSVRLRVFAPSDALTERADSNVLVEKDISEIHAIQLDARLLKATPRSSLLTRPTSGAWPWTEAATSCPSSTRPGPLVLLITSSGLGWSFGRTSWLKRFTSETLKRFSKFSI